MPNMCTLLLIYVLSVKSSYLQNKEEIVSDAPDTIQFCQKNGEAWRVKTFAIDHDVHVWRLGKLSAKRLEILAEESTKKNYGDVLARKVKVKAQRDGSDLTVQLSRAGLPPYLEALNEQGFAFWVHAPNLYSTKSTPQ